MVIEKLHCAQNHEMEVQHLWNRKKCRLWHRGASLWLKATVHPGVQSLFPVSHKHVIAWKLRARYKFRLPESIVILCPSCCEVRSLVIVRHTHRSKVITINFNYVPLLSCNIVADTLYVTAEPNFVSNVSNRVTVLIIDNYYNLLNLSFNLSPVTYMECSVLDLLNVMYVKW